MSSETSEYKNYNEANQKVANEWDEFATSWDEMPMVVNFTEKALDIVTKSVPFFAEGKGKEKVALDFGCGSGIMTTRLATLCEHVVAVDIAPKMIAVLDKKIETSSSTSLGNVTTWTGDIVPAGLPEELTKKKFDLVFSGSVINFCPEPEKVLKRLTEVMAPGGYAVHVIFLRPEAGEEREVDFSEGLSENEMRDALTSAGLSVVSVNQRVTMEGEEGGWIAGVGKLE